MENFESKCIKQFESNTKILKESIEQMEQHPERNVVKTLEELEELADG